MTKLQTPERYRIVERRYETAPPLPTDRPPTKAEVWAYYSHIFGDTKTAAELKSEAKATWAWKYVDWWLRRDWRKQPDWVEGDPVIEAAVPHIINTDNWQKAVNAAWEKAQEAKAA